MAVFLDVIGVGVLHPDVVAVEAQGASDLELLAVPAAYAVTSSRLPLRLPLRRGLLE